MPAQEDSRDKVTQTPKITLTAEKSKKMWPAPNPAEKIRSGRPPSQNRGDLMSSTVMYINHTSMSLTHEGSSGLDPCGHIGFPRGSVKLLSETQSEYRTRQAPSDDRPIHISVRLIYMGPYGTSWGSPWPSEPCDGRTTAVRRPYRTPCHATSPIMATRDS